MLVLWGSEFRGTPMKITGTRPGSLFNKPTSVFHTVVGPAGSRSPLVQNYKRKTRVVASSANRACTRNGEHRWDGAAPGRQRGQPGDGPDGRGRDRRAGCQLPVSLLSKDPLCQLDVDWSNCLCTLGECWSAICGLHGTRAAASTTRSLHAYACEDVDENSWQSRLRHAQTYVCQEQSLVV